MSDSTRIPTEHPGPVIVQSPGVIGIASETIGALKASPLLLLVVLLNAAFVAVGYFYLSNQQKGLEKLVATLFDRCLPDVHGEAYILPPGATPKVQSPDGSFRDLPPEKPP